MRTGRAIGAIGLAVSLVPALVGLVASTMLAVDYVRPTPAFCVEGGCEALKHTVYATPIPHVPMPFFGIAGFIAIGVAACWPGRRARMVQLLLSVGAALLGAALIMLQMVIGQFCPFCMVADAAGLFALLAASARLWVAPDAEVPFPAVITGGVSIAAALAVPLVKGFLAPPVPVVIRDEMARTPAGEATVVDFVDFECPFCRMTHAELEPLLEEHAKQVRVVRRQMPLRSHPHAMDAARAACCGEQLGKGDAMANALFTAPEDDLTPEGCEKLAASLGLPLDAYRACVKNAATDALIDADKAEFKAAGGFALPTIWIGDTRFVGAQSHEALEKALDRAIARTGS
ncbi:MAG TPA: thioredoxin domain-containing protein [Polyangiaceae bacterium]